LHSWQIVAIAASLLLAVAAGMLPFLKKSDDSNQPGAQIAQSQPALADVLPREVVPPLIPAEVPTPPENRVAQQVIPIIPPDPIRVEEIPPPRLKGADVLVAPPLAPIPPLARLLVRVPLLVSVAELDREDVLQKLTEELGRDAAYRVDLFTYDAARGAELFQAAAKTAGVNLLTDATAVERMKKKQAHAYAVYLECLSAAEIRDLFAAIATHDAKNKLRVFDMLHATAAIHADQIILKELLGTDPGLWKRTAAKSPATIPTEPKPISSSTGDQITRNLTSPKAIEKPAILMSFTPAAIRTSPAMSKELKEFLARRGERKASAVPILIVIRQPNG
jgi:hypothetical protein